MRACVLDNLIRYDPPERAVIVQYLDIEGACRARLEGAPAAQVTVVPLPDGSGGGEGTSAPLSRGATTPGASGDPAVPAGEGGTTGGPASAAPDNSSATRPNDPRAADGTALPVVRVALQRSEVGGVTSPTAAADAPAWVILVVIAAFVAVVGGAWMEVQRRRR